MTSDPAKEAKPKGQRSPAKPKDNGVVSLDIPVDSCFPGFATQWIDCRLTARQAAALKVLWSSLSECGQRYSGGPGQNPKGTPVENAPSAVRWLLDRLADAIEQQSGKDLLRDSELVFR